MNASNPQKPANPPHPQSQQNLQNPANPQAAHHPAIFYPAQWHALLHQVMQEQRRQQAEMEEAVRRLQERQDELARKLDSIKPLHIENINYKIQELTVQELKGTLNIGMTALTDPDEIQKWLQAGDQDVQMRDLSHPDPDAGKP